MTAEKIIIRHLGLQPYLPIWEKMREFTQQRTADTPDELWLLEHYPVFTQGQAGKAEHILNAQQIPIVQTDRGGQVTYHGPGQLVVYPLLNLSRKRLNIRELVTGLENVMIIVLAEFSIPAQTRCQAPGVYTGSAKIGSIGLRVRRGCSYHGLALNVAMDLQPFSAINPCGFQNLQMTQIQHFAPAVTLSATSAQLVCAFLKHFRYTIVQEFNE